jgi:hypothetical protein
MKLSLLTFILKQFIEKRRGTEGVVLEGKCTVIREMWNQSTWLYSLATV